MTNASEVRSIRSTHRRWSGSLASRSARIGPVSRISANQLRADRRTGTISSRAAAVAAPVPLAATPTRGRRSRRSCPTSRSTISRRSRESEIWRRFASASRVARSSESAASVVLRVVTASDASTRCILRNRNLRHPTHRAIANTCSPPPLRVGGVGWIARRREGFAGESDGTARTVLVKRRT